MSHQPAIYSQDDPPTSASNLLTPMPGATSPVSRTSSPVHAALARRPSNGSLLSASPSQVWESAMGKDSSATSTVASKYSLLDGSAFPGANVVEPDDYLHNPDPRRDKHSDNGGTFFTARGLANLGCLAFLFFGILMLLCVLHPAGYPLLSHFTKKTVTVQGAFGIGGANSSGQIPDIPGHRALIDADTPQAAMTRTSWTDPSKTLQLIWSDEFNVDGRTFYPGDDPYWEALDLNYWQTGDVEWYDPAAVTTAGGYLTLTLSKKNTHNKNYQGGMLSTWNQFCFTGGLIEASVILPGSPDVLGFWPAVWTMGNLGRVGYGASTDGLWPYSYDACDYGTVKNQSVNGAPAADFLAGAGDKYNNNFLSFLPGQRLSRCTCPNETHPGPMHSDNTFVGRSAPEIDIFEALATTAGNGNVSQSGQFAPFNWAYEWDFTSSGTYNIPNSSTTSLNGYMGGIYQQAVSALSITNTSAYELTSNISTVYGIEYRAGFDNAYITWVNNNQVAWTLYSTGMVADNKTQISARPIPQEPMYLIANLGMSDSFVRIDYNNLQFPATMRIDYIRVYQDPSNINWGCDPQDFPTASYIDTFKEAYTNPNYTLWSDIGQTFPKNKFLGEC
ncbi:beta-glucan synthesis-associated [Vararia minispora EC-137]|uniref:Beta-glucan synthesis-associated n=1 Tax=Vararia minispora EC-137 TaxID=1314806 RepID=A0ACB8QEJ8_9AGAM|nr:beta-glucan synthesis-associated [Vararia minispora EC-137]